MLRIRNFTVGFCLVLGVTVLLLFIPTVNAQIGVTVEGVSTPIYVNEEIQLTAIATMGTPPYSYQWYTQLISRDPNNPTAIPDGDIIAVQGANAASFNFSENLPGWYGISIRVSDSLNNSVYDSFPPAGILIKVIPLPAPTSSAAPATASPTVPEFPYTLLLTSMVVFLLIAQIAKTKLKNYD